MGCVQSIGNQQGSKHRKLQIERIRQQLQKKNKQIGLLEKQNTQLKNRKQQQVTAISQNNRQNQMIIEFQQNEQNVQGDQQNNQQTEITNPLKCTICEYDYDLHSRIPWMVCANQHTYCSYCIIKMTTKNQNRCPQCRQPITSGNKNVQLCSVLQNINNKLTKLKNTQPAKQINISLNPNNKYKQKFNYFPPDTIIKGPQHAWYGLLFNEILPPEGKYAFCIQVMFSIHNNIEVGIIDMLSKVEQGRMSNKRISYHLIDGKIMHSGNIDMPNTVWKSSGTPSPKNVVSKVVVEVNMDDNLIKWTVNEHVVGETVITNYLKYAKPVPYLSMHHSEDVVNLNAW